MAGEAGAVVVSAAGPITVPAEEDDNEDELIMETTAVPSHKNLQMQ